MKHLLRATLLGATLLAGTARAAEPTKLPFVTHAAFFSGETKQDKPIDPQVFVRDDLASAGTGPQGIKHASGFRPAFIQTDPATAPLYNANGTFLGFNLGTWLGAKGRMTLTPKSNGTIVSASFTKLRPNAEYSLFENHFDQTPVGFTPLDGKGTANSFKTDVRGTGHLRVTSPDKLTHANAVLLILNDDGQSHGTSRGDIGVSAQHQLISRPEE